MLRILFAAGLLALPPAAGAAAQQQPSGAVGFPHAQALVDDVVRRNPDMLDVILHVSPQPDAGNVVIAAHLRKANGEASGEDDLGVARTGAPLVEVQKDGVRLGILLQLRDSRHRAIGAVGLMYPYKPGEDVEAVVRRSFAIRDALALRIPSRAALVG
ncbi:hypothetical protein SR41_16705 [Sphingomonas melonis]|uniref:Uncharacterized protein n=1 Tax=Sphingomonas melonis TaxID=152682 RepID=A0A0D1JXS6_9SPHN|nr:hypothetical protein [Sphingomonas melonis]KIU26013.1 hypothetical protein SR41_16705 [Sphingomonas melonis]